jgi:hypothetical protein
MNWIAVGLVVENGSFNASNLADDVTVATGQVMGLIGFAMLAAIALGILVAIWYLLTQGS